jgi:hypothetical protein
MHRLSCSSACSTLPCPSCPCLTTSFADPEMLLTHCCPAHATPCPPPSMQAAASRERCGVIAHILSTLDRVTSALAAHTAGLAARLAAELARAESAAARLDGEAGEGTGAASVWPADCLPAAGPAGGVRMEQGASRPRDRLAQQPVCSLPAHALRRCVCGGRPQEPWWLRLGAWTARSRC